MKKYHYSDPDEETEEDNSINFESDDPIIKGGQDPMEIK